MTEQTAATLQTQLTNAGLLTSIRNDAAGFRVLAVSYCDRDLYSGAGRADPNNPNLNPDGSHKTTNGLLATKAAIAYTESLYPTSHYFVSGGSAGSAGSYEVAWAEEKSGNPPIGVVGDASVLNAEQGTAAYTQGACQNPAFGPAATIVQQRFAARDRQHRQRARQAGDAWRAHRDVAAHLESRRREHLWQHPDDLPLPRRQLDDDGRHWPRSWRGSTPASRPSRSATGVGLRARRRRSGVRPRRPRATRAGRPACRTSRGTRCRARRRATCRSHRRARPGSRWSR